MAPVPRTPLHEVQARQGARFGEVDGWEIARAFTGIQAERAAARQGAALVDRSHQGRLRLTGRKRVDLLHRLCTQDLKSLAAGQGARAAMLTDKGRLIDDLRLSLFDDHLLLITSPGRAEGLKRHIESLRFRDDVSIEEITAHTAMILIAGPRAAGLLADAVAAGRADAGPAASWTDLPRHHHREVSVAGVPLTASRAAGLHEASFRLVMPAEGAPAVWEALLAAGASHGALPMGEDAHEVRRIERGVPRAGREITEEHNPLEARLDDAISWTKGCYIGQEVVARLDSRQKVSRLLSGLRLADDAAGTVRPGDTLEAPERPGVPAGRVTSVAEPPASDRALALAYVRQDLSAPGTSIRVVSAGRTIAATVSDLPFAES
jgi:folate-binding protein YgfZ